MRNILYPALGRLSNEIPIMLPSAAAPLFDAKGESFPKSAQQAKSWCRVKNLDLATQAAELAPQMNPIARDVCTALGCAPLTEMDAADKGLRASRDYFALDVPDSVPQDAARFLQYRRAAQAMGEYPAKFDLLRRNAESHMQSGGPLPEVFISILRMQTAAPPRYDKSLVVPSVQESSGVHAAAVRCDIFPDRLATVRDTRLRWRRKTRGSPSIPQILTTLKREWRTTRKKGKWKRGCAKPNGLNPWTGGRHVVCATVNFARYLGAHSVGAKSRWPRPLFSSQCELPSTLFLRLVWRTGAFARETWVPMVQEGGPRVGSSSVPAEPLSGSSESAAALDTGAPATLACCKWPHHHTAALERLEAPITGPDPACAELKFGNGRMEEVRFAAENLRGVAGRQGTLNTFLLGADIPTPLR